MKASTSTRRTLKATTKTIPTAGTRLATANPSLAKQTINSNLKTLNKILHERSNITNKRVLSDSNIQNIDDKNATSHSNVQTLINATLSAIGELEKMEAKLNLRELDLEKAYSNLIKSMIDFDLRNIIVLIPSNIQKTELSKEEICAKSQLFKAAESLRRPLCKIVEFMEDDSKSKSMGIICTVIKETIEEIALCLDIVCVNFHQYKNSLRCFPKCELIHLSELVSTQGIFSAFQQVSTVSKLIERYIKLSFVDDLDINVSLPHEILLDDNIELAGLMEYELRVLKAFEDKLSGSKVEALLIEKLLALYYALLSHLRPHYLAIAYSWIGILTLESGKQAISAFKRALIIWRSILANIPLCFDGNTASQHDIEKTKKNIDDVERFYGHLRLNNGIKDDVKDPYSDSVALYIQIGKIYLNLGYTGKAGLAFSQAKIILDSHRCVDDVHLSWMITQNDARHRKHEQCLLADAYLTRSYISIRLDQMNATVNPFLVDDKAADESNLAKDENHIGGFLTLSAQQADYFFKEALNLIEVTKANSAMSLFLLNIAELEYRKHCWKESKEKLEKALEYQLKEIDQVIEYLTKVYDLAYECGPTQLLQETSLSITMMNVIKSYGQDQNLDQSEVATMCAYYLEMTKALTAKRQMIAKLNEKLQFSVTYDDMQWPKQITTSACLNDIKDCDNDSSDETDSQRDFLKTLLKQYTKELSLTYEQFQSEFLDILPHNWVVCSISIDIETNDIEGDEGGFTYSDAIKEFNDILELSNQSMRAGKMSQNKHEKVEWWKERTQLDLRLKELLDNIENYWLGGFKGILMANTHHDPNQISRFKEKMDSINFKCDVRKLSVKHQIKNKLDIDVELYKSLLRL
ncbi:16724_t:CDS:10, partial [Racocetra fulgida]